MNKISLPPFIAPIGEGSARPLWSVMIPTFNCAKYLRQTLTSVLAQGYSLEQMQIEVIDDCSTADDPEAVVHELGVGRVGFHRKLKNAGAIANFNTCIERSQGRLVHILHGDDYVLAGFYDLVGAAFAAAPELGACFTRAQIVDEADNLETISDRIPHLKTATRKVDSLLYGNQINTPAVVVRRSVYEQYGGFRPELVHVADWEMWIRCIARGSAVQLNQVLAAYRLFPGNDTGRLARSGENVRDFLRLSQILGVTYPEFNPDHFIRVARNQALVQMKQFKASGDLESFERNQTVWLETTPLVRRIRQHVKEVILPLLG